jgi:hypothetical protein
MNEKIFKQLSDKREIGSGDFYQIPGKAGGAHRIFGYRKDGIFFLVLDDEEHEVLPCKR